MDRQHIEIATSQHHQIFLNPTLEKSITEHCKDLVQIHDSTQPCVWIMSSGTSATTLASYKLIGLSQKALFASAEGVNRHLAVTSTDCWLNCLPLFHVGGLSILYRAYLSSVECFNLWSLDYRWNPEHFFSACEENKITLTSLVPTQVFDLVSLNIKAPETLRAVVVGGARLNENLLHQARALGWPLLPSFGMTEAASQIATASLESLKSNQQNYPALQVLPHMRVKTTPENRLLIAGPSLMDGYYYLSENSKSKWINAFHPGEWFLTQDCARIENNSLTLLARVDEVVKVRGENVNLASLRNRLETFLAAKSLTINGTIVALPEDRLGHQLALVGSCGRETLSKITLEFNQMVLPFERIEKIFDSMEIPRTPLGKISHAKLTESITQSLPESL